MGYKSLEQRRAYGRRWVKSNPDKMRTYRLRHAYRITQGRYEELHNAQGGLCAICLRPETRVHRKSIVQDRLSIDHDHATGLIRGLLCSSCNLAIGKMDDSPDRLRAAAKYLEDHKWPKPPIAPTAK